MTNMYYNAFVMTLLQKHNSRNSLLELYRFIFAVWVMYHHGFFFWPKSTHFFNGYIAVEFFFMLIGFFMIRAFQKEENNSFWKGLWNITWKKLKPLGITLVICLIFAKIYFWYFYPDGGGYVGYLWYIEWLIIIPMFFYLLYRLIKNKKIFYSILALAIVACHVLQYTVCPGWGILRAVVGLGIGVLISLIPKNNLKIKNFNLNIVFSLFFIVSTVIIAFFGYYINNVDQLFILVLFPGLIYFANCVDIRFKPFAILGDLSFGIYVYQTIPRFFERLGFWKNNAYMCLIVFALAIADYLVRVIIDYCKQKRIDSGRAEIENT